MITGILLASGSATRFGSNKLLHPLASGNVIAVESALNLSAHVDKLICVVRPEDTALISLLKENVTHTDFKIYQNPMHLSGMGSSIKTGIENSLESDYWIIALGDMPYIQKNTYSKLVQQISVQQNSPTNARNIIRPIYTGNQNIPGHPVAFPQRYQEALLTLTGDEGGRNIIAKNSIEKVMVEDIGITQDIDQMSDIKPTLSHKKFNESHKQ